MKQNRRREIQEAYNEKHGITPKTIQKEIRDVIRATICCRRRRNIFETVQKLNEINERKRKNDCNTWKKK